jgi:hypothetical protein
VRAALRHHGDFLNPIHARPTAITVQSLMLRPWRFFSNKGEMMDAPAHATASLLHAATTSARAARCMER